MDNTIVQAGRNRQRTTDGSAGSGLDAAGVQASLLRYGDNRLSRKKQAGFFRQFLHNLNDPIIRILIGALVLNILFLFPDIDWYECGGIAFAVFISAFVSTVSEYGSGRAFAKLYERLGETEYTVLRDGKWQTVGVGDLVCLDVISLRPGEIVPVDGILLSGTVKVDEASLTGESRPADRTADPGILQGISLEDLPSLMLGDPFAVFRGSAVCAGECVILAVRVGDQTMYGQVASQLQDSDLPSPLKERLTRLAGSISKIGYASAAFVALAHLFHAFVMESGMNLSVMLTRMQDFSFVWSECLAAFTMAISILVVAVPEGLPMMITVVLSSNMKKMMKNGVLVRKMVGIETAGCLSMLFTDKTGTLTTGNLTVAETVTGGGRVSDAASLGTVYTEILREGAVVCGGTGNQTERAIERYLGVSGNGKPASVLARIPFSSDKKYSAALTAERGYIRGAAEILLSRCTTWLDARGVERIMDSRKRMELMEVIREAASRCGRVLLQGQVRREDFGLLESRGLEGISVCFTALLILQDEIREQVPASVAECRAAGIQVVMITGDNEWTAAAIGQRTGILSGSWQMYDPAMQVRYGTELVLRGQDLRGLPDETLRELMPYIRVISRVTPTDKSRLIRAAQAAGHVVGMTGDGINDAPALKGADVGFAMGSGTDVAREAGDIVITDDNFVSIGRAVLYGRTIFQSIRKFIVFQLIMNLSAVGVSLLGPLCGIEHPVTVIQMLWVNIIMDTLGSLAFAGEPPLAEYMKQPPLHRQEPILTGSMVRQILLSAAYGITLCMGFLNSSLAWYELGRGDTDTFLTVFFALFVFCGVNYAFTVRTPRINLFASLGRNRSFLVIMPAVALVQLLIIYFGGTVFRTVPLEPVTLMWCALLALTVIPMDMIRKRIFRNR